MPPSNKKTAGKEAKVKVEFVDDVEVRDHNGEIEFAASAGDVVALPASSANRWLRRGSAVEPGTAPAPEPEAEAEADAEPAAEPELNLEPDPEAPAE